MLKTIVGFLSRAHGLNILSSLVESNQYRILKVYTHSLNPKSQDPKRSIRTDYHLFKEICAKYDIPLVSIDSNKEKIQDVPNCDFIVEASWRYLLLPDITKKAKIMAFGIHRGKLPEYAGAEPIKQALLQNENEIILSAHYLDSSIDTGKTITRISHPVNYDSSFSIDKNIQRLRDEITPLFSIIMFKTFKIISE
jgi:methionyl-tRNA formyltransferase